MPYLSLFNLSVSGNCQGQYYSGPFRRYYPSVDDVGNHAPAPSPAHVTRLQRYVAAEAVQSLATVWQTARQWRVEVTTGYRCLGPINEFTG